MRDILQKPAIFDFVQQILKVDQVRDYFVSQYAKPKRGDRVLDIGCGTGELQPFFEGCDYFGFDNDEKYLRSAQANFGHGGKFEVGDISTIQFEENSFDIAIAAGVIHHLDDSQARAMFKLAKKVLKPGGRLCSFDMCYRDRRFFPNLMNWIDRGEHIRKPAEYLGFARETFSNVQEFDYCGQLLIPVTHCVMVCTKD